MLRRRRNCPFRGAERNHAEWAGEPPGQEDRALRGEAKRRSHSGTRGATTVLRGSWWSIGRAAARPSLGRYWGLWVSAPPRFLHIEVLNHARGSGWVVGMHASVASVELHTVDLRAEGLAWESWVSDLASEERARAERYAFPGGQRRFVVARASLRRLLGSRLGVPASEVQLVDGSHGKPALAPCHAPASNGLAFNLTHSGELALIAIGQGDLGVDLESPLRLVDAMAVVRRFFSEAERNGFEALPAGAERERLFFRVWTRKEALVKAVGRGLSCSLSSFTVPIGELSRDGAVIDCPERSGRRWRLFEIGDVLRLGADWVASLVVAERE